MPRQASKKVAEPRKRAALYDRTSVRDESSVDEHLGRCDLFAQSRGWDVVWRDADHGVSGYRDRRRDKWDEVRGMVEREEVDVVVVFAVSRAGRNAARLFQFVEECEAHHVTFTSATEPIDTSGDYGRVFLAILAALAEMESKSKRDRALVGRDKNEREGKWSGGRRLFGLRPEGTPRHEGGDGFRLVVDDEEARLLKEAATDIINGASKSTVVKRWNDAGVRTTRGNRWTPAALDFTLSNPSLVRAHILTASSQRRVVQAFDGRRTGQRADRYFLTGILTCAVCSGTMSGRVSYQTRGEEKIEVPRYVCVNTPEMHLTANARAVDALVSRLVAERPERDREELLDPADELVQEREAKERELEELGESDLPLAAIRGRARRLQREIEVLDARLDRVRPRAAAEALGEDYSVDDHRRYVEQMVERVVLYPATQGTNRFDPSRVVVEWRGEKPKPRGRKVKASKK